MYYGRRYSTPAFHRTLHRRSLITHAVPCAPFGNNAINNLCSVAWILAPNLNLYVNNQPYGRVTLSCKRVECLPKCAEEVERKTRKEESSAKGQAEDAEERTYWRITKQRWIQENCFFLESLVALLHTWKHKQYCKWRNAVHHSPANGVSENFVIALNRSKYMDQNPSWEPNVTTQVVALYGTESLFPWWLHVKGPHLVHSVKPYISTPIPSY